MNAFYRFIIGLSAALLLIGAAVSYLAQLYWDAGVCAVSFVVTLCLWEWLSRETDRREQMRTYRESVWERRLK